MKMTDMRAKARAIFGPANPEPMPNQPNGAKALQERANARPIPTYKVGGSVKKPTPPQPTAAEREADRKRRESLANTKVTQSEADTLGRAMRSEGPRYKHGGKVHTSSDTARKLATEMGGMKKGGAMKAVDSDKNPGLKKLPAEVRNKMGYMKKGGKPKKDGLAVMIAIGAPMKGMKKPMKKMDGGSTPPVKTSDLMAKGGMKKPVKKMGGGMAYAEGGKPEKFAQGGAGKVRKGMMTPEGKIIDAMNKARGK
jgi:hypothetical protein